MTAEPETQTEPETPLPARSRPDNRWPAWWPSFIGAFLAISMMVLALFTPIILLFIVVLSAWIIHHSGH